ncbi:Peptidase family S41 [Mucilaginibacter mallensis]|uniref:Peptidase family S41 n=1 Tax=Mucilaginibacter mallensis TaxID=652787 RepID=A0A1H1V6X2_MUCMA|nr:S41 family peptidase [Mucilaginibacter mallensis]SDS80029.1 Peptidase family S41 [Mucilaginibacter mallensis]
MKKLFFFIIILSAGLIASCKKDKSTKAASTLDQIRDSIYYYEKEDYLWNDAIPSYSTFDPRSYTSDNDQDALNSEIFSISQLKINPATNAPYEYFATNPLVPKYSFIDDGTETASLNGTNGDFGFEPAYIADEDLRVKYVYAGSPADLAGIKRGYQITNINGTSTPSSDNNSNLNFVIDAIYYSPTIKMTLLKPDGTSINVSLATASYTVNPVITYKVFNEGSGHKIGYMVFNSFTALANAQPQLNTAFDYFITNGINELVVDLRYNGGGAGETAEYLDDLIVPAAKSNTLMYTQYFNSNLQNDKDPLLSKKYNLNPGQFLPANNQTQFVKKLSLNISRVFFIVTNETASSSELTINNLLPELNIILIGSTTYGKPVGEIPIPINKYYLYSPQLYVENSANKGDYYSGMIPGTGTYPGKLAADDITKEFGDSTEMLLSYALNYVKDGTFALKIPQGLSNQKTFSVEQSRAVSLELNKHKFRPMIFKSKAKR